jgi:uncharacterized protein YecA (UPF0149 family)
MNIPNQPLSDTEIDTLDAFLTADSTSEEVLAIDELHGYLTGMVCCPVPVMPSDWLAGVWQAEEGAQFESAEQAREIMALIMRKHNDIADGPPQPFRRQAAKVGRNDPGPCGSGKKYKKCCRAAANLH